MKKIRTARQGQTQEESKTRLSAPGGSKNLSRNGTAQKPHPSHNENVSDECNTSYINNTITDTFLDDLENLSATNISDSKMLKHADKATKKLEML